MTMEQAVTHLQQELFTLRAQVAAESGLADAVRAINNFATAQVRKDTPSFIDVKVLGCPKEFTGREPTGITTTAVDLEFLPTDPNEDRRLQNLEYVLQQMHTALMALTSYEANDIVANSRKNPLEAWGKLQKRYEPTTGGRKRNLLRTIISPGRCSLLELQTGIERWEIERWESYVSRFEKKMKDKLDDEIKLAGLESLVPEELEKHLAGVLMNGMMTGVLLDGTKVGNKRMTLPQAHFHLEVWMSVPPFVRSDLNG